MQVFLTVGATWTNMPAALTEFNGVTTGRQKLDIGAYNFVRLSAEVESVASVAAATLRLQYSLDAGSTWAYFDAVSGPKVLVDAASGTVTGPWCAVPAAAQGDVLIRLVGIGGDGAVDPVIGAVVAQFAM